MRDQHRVLRSQILDRCTGEDDPGARRAEVVGCAPGQGGREQIHGFDYDTTRFGEAAPHLFRPRPFARLDDLGGVEPGARLAVVRPVPASPVTRTDPVAAAVPGGSTIDRLVSSSSNVNRAAPLPAIRSTDADKHGPVDRRMLQFASRPIGASTAKARSSA